MLYPAVFLCSGLIQAALDWNYIALWHGDISDLQSNGWDTGVAVGKRVLFISRRWKRNRWSAHTSFGLRRQLEKADSSPVE